MENHAPDPVSAGAARERLATARRARAASARRAATPAGLILSSSLVCGALTLSAAHRELGGAVTIIAVLWLLAELALMSARNQWRGLRSLPRPRWNLIEVALIAAGLLLGGLIGPHVLASRTNSTLASWGLAAAVAIAVAVLLFSANASYRHRSA